MRSAMNRKYGDDILWRHVRRKPATGFLEITAEEIRTVQWASEEEILQTAKKGSSLYPELIKAFCRAWCI